MEVRNFLFLTIVHLGFFTLSAVCIVCRLRWLFLAPACNVKTAILCLGMLRSNKVVAAAMLLLVTMMALLMEP